MIESPGKIFAARAKVFFDARRRARLWPDGAVQLSTGARATSPTLVTHLDAMLAALTA